MLQESEADHFDMYIPVILQTHWSCNKYYSQFSLGKSLSSLSVIMSKKWKYTVKLGDTLPLRLYLSI